MEKQFADQVMEQFFQKIYGFAIKKTFSMEEAEELCAEMVKEVYLSVLKSREIVNVEGYIWKICENTFAKYVSHKKERQGVSLDGVILPYYDEYDLGETEEELRRLRREIAFLSQKRREIVYSFYYLEKFVAQIAGEMKLSEGTVKWHLNKARNDLKEGIGMERKIGKLGLSPIKVLSVEHAGNPGRNGGPEQFLEDKINVNIVYSVYWTPRNLEEIAEELGMTPVFIEDRVRLLEENGFLVRTKGNRYTTYVKFSPKSVSIEEGENVLKMKVRAARELVERYVPKVRAAIADFTDVYIPSGNRELFEAAVISYAIAEKCAIPIQRDLSNYRIRTLDGGDYMVFVKTETQIRDPEYVPELPEASRDYSWCGAMRRDSDKYRCVRSWSADSRYCSRKGHWQNNWNADYDYLYEVITGKITENDSNAEKFARLREREYLTPDGKVNIMVVKEEMDTFFARIPEPDKEIVDRFAGIALETAMQQAKEYPPQMQDRFICKFVGDFIGGMGAMMVMDILYENGIFKPLTEQERVTSQLLMFSDRLPE